MIINNYIFILSYAYITQIVSDCFLLMTLFERNTSNITNIIIRLKLSPLKYYYILKQYI